MPLSIRDEETTRLVRQLAARKGIGLTEAVRTAVKKELASAESELSISQKIAALRREVMSRGGDVGAKADKAFYDWLCEDD